MLSNHYRNTSKWEILQQDSLHDWMLDVGRLVLGSV